MIARSRTCSSLPLDAERRDELLSELASLGRATALAAVTALATNVRREIFDGMGGSRSA